MFLPCHLPLNRVGAEHDASKPKPDFLCQTTLLPLHATRCAHDTRVPAQPLSASLSNLGTGHEFEGRPRASSPCGTPGFVAPEQIKKSGYDYAVDLWALGVITCAMGMPQLFTCANVRMEGGCL